MNKNTFTPAQADIVAEFRDYHGLKSEQISFDGDSLDPIFDYDALNLLRLKLTDLQCSKPYLIERDEATGYVTVMFEITMADERRASDIGTAQIGETMPGGNVIDNFIQAQNVAIARAMRRAIRAAGIRLLDVHQKFIETGEIASGEPNQELKNPRGREIHALMNEYGHTDSQYRDFIENLFGTGKRSSLALNDLEKSQLITTYRSMINFRKSAERKAA